jgi:tetratricopeptide (TPR) repeat protein
VLGEALTCFDALARRDPGVAAHRSARLGILQQFAEMAFQRGNMAEASERYAQAAELQRTMVEEDPSPSRLASLGVLLQGLGEAQFQAQRIAAADATTSEAIEVLERAARERPGDPFAVRLLALSLVNRARFLRSRGQREDAISFAQRALELARGLRDVGPVETPKLLHTLARAQVILGVLHLEGGARSAALEACRAATATLEQLPPEQRRLAEPYASAYAQLAARLGS